jgi:hypothetical protein
MNKIDKKRFFLKMNLFFSSFFFFLLNEVFFVFAPDGTFAKLVKFLKEDILKAESGGYLLISFILLTLFLYLMTREALAKAKKLNFSAKTRSWMSGIISIMTTSSLYFILFQLITDEKQLNNYIAVNLVGAGLTCFLLIPAGIFITNMISKSGGSHFYSQTKDGQGVRGSFWQLVLLVFLYLFISNLYNWLRKVLGDVDYYVFWDDIYRFEFKTIFDVDIGMIAGIILIILLYFSIFGRKKGSDKDYEPDEYEKGAIDKYVKDPYKKIRGEKNIENAKKERTVKDRVKKINKEIRGIDDNFKEVGKSLDGLLKDSKTSRSGGQE